MFSMSLHHHHSCRKDDQVYILCALGQSSKGAKTQGLHASKVHLHCIQVQDQCRNSDYMGQSPAAVHNGAIFLERIGQLLYVYCKHLYPQIQKDYHYFEKTISLHLHALSAVNGHGHSHRFSVQNHYNMQAEYFHKTLDIFQVLYNFLVGIC